MEIERLRTPLVAIPDDRDPLARQGGRIDVGVLQKFQDPFALSLSKRCLLL
jgi:hypothetical protein